MATSAEEASEGYRALKVPEVRRLCQERGLPTEGTKNELIARLETQAEPQVAIESQVQDTPKAPDESQTHDTNQAQAATPAVPAQASEPPATVQPLAGEVSETPATARPAPATSAVANATSASSGTSVELTKDERALRGLLQFCVCSEVRRQSNEEMRLNMKYRELISTCFDVIKDTIPVTAAAVSSTTPVPSDWAGVSTSIAEAKVDSRSPNEHPSSTDAPAKEHDAPRPARSLEGRERLKQQLLAKQQELAQQVQLLRKRAAATVAVSAFVAPVSGTAVTSVQSGPEASAPSTSRLSVPDSSESHEDRERALKRKWEECIDATIETERLQARKDALEELLKKLRAEHEAKREERIRALKLVHQRRDEEAHVLGRARDAVASSDGLRTR